MISYSDRSLNIFYRGLNQTEKTLVSIPAKDLKNPLGFHSVLKDKNGRIDFYLACLPDQEDKEKIKNLLEKKSIKIE